MANKFNLDHFCLVSGKVGRLQTVTSLPVYAGDSMNISLSMAMSLSPLRQPLAIDPRIDFYAFYRPHRHQYGSLWTQFLSEGVDESVTFPFDNITQGKNGDLEILGQRVGGNVPKYLYGGYREIYNRYFRDPSSAEFGITDPNDLDEDQRKYGIRCCHLFRPWNGGLADLDASIRESMEVDVNSNKIDVLSIDDARAEYGTKLSREWFNQADRYTDLMKAVWGTSVNTDADERPTILAEKGFWMNGQVVSGIDEVGQAAMTGSTFVRANFGFPRRRFREHGCVYVMALVRYPPIIFDESNTRALRPNPEYHQISADYDVLKYRESRDTLASDFWLGGDGSNYLRHLPDNHHYRWAANRVTKDFEKLEGFPILEPKSRIGPYINSNDYDKIFRNHALGHWHLQGMANVGVIRNVPDAKQSIFTGAR